MDIRDAKIRLSEAVGIELDAIGESLNPRLERTRIPVMAMSVSGNMIANGDFECEADEDYRGRIYLAISGGPAFGDAGMTLRDYFAAKAINGLCVEAGKANPERVLAHASCAANAAYAIADAMLRERAK